MLILKGAHFQLITNIKTEIIIDKAMWNVKALNKYDAWIIESLG